MTLSKLLFVAILCQLLLWIVSCNEKVSKINHIILSDGDVSDSNKLVASDSLICFNSFDQLHKENDSSKIQFYEVKLSSKPRTIDSTIINAKIPIFTRKLLISDDHQIIYIDGNGELNGYPEISDSISLNGAVISLKELFDDIAVKKESLSMNIRKIYYFRFNSNKYYLFLMDHNYSYGFINFTYPLLAEITDSITSFTLLGKKGINHKNGTTLRVYPDYLGDFDTDGKLDFAYFDIENNRVESYSINESKLTLQEGFELKIVKTKVNEFPPFCFNFKINLTKSKWYHSIDGYSPKFCDSCNLEKLDMSKIYSK